MISFTMLVACSCPTSLAILPVVISSWVASSFFTGSSVLPLAVSYAIIMPVRAPVPDTSKGEAASTSQFTTPEVESVVAIMLLVTQLRFAVFTWIPPEAVGFTRAQL